LEQRILEGEDPAAASSTSIEGEDPAAWLGAVRLEPVAEEGEKQECRACGWENKWEQHCADQRNKGASDPSKVKTKVNVLSFGTVFLRYLKVLKFFFNLSH
jgi:hypothetical protein